MDPEHAVEAHLDQGADTLLPVYWTTFNLAFHAWVKPFERTLATAKVQGVRVVMPRPGEVVDWSEPFKNEPRYRGPR